VPNAVVDEFQVYEPLIRAGACRRRPPVMPETLGKLSFWIPDSLSV